MLVYHLVMLPLELGQSDATPVFDLQNANGYNVTVLNGSITNDQLDGSIANNKLAHDTVSINGSDVALGVSCTW